MSLGDSYRGFRIVGTTPAYITHYGAQPGAGRAVGTPCRPWPGAQAASNGRAGAGRAVHRLARSGRRRGMRMATRPYTVAGVLAPCGCVLDRLILTATESVWQVHEKATAVDEEDRKALQAEREITLALIRYKSPLAAVTFPRFVNTTTDMQAAAPAVEVTRLLRMVGVGTDVLRGFGAVLLLAAGLSVFIALWNAVRERRADLAMLRMLGASPARVAALLVCEALWLALLASVLGLALGHLLTGLVGWLLQAERSLPLSGWLWVPAVAWVPLAAAGVAMAAALIPALHARRMDVAQLLNTR
jgi:putative ABC transport system permease protein